jgi:hypothetical protein
METRIRAQLLSPFESVRPNDALKPRAVANSPNYLSLAPRPIPNEDQCFDSDGPGSISSAGVRHDNDFVKISDIRLLPTTDEILCLRRPYMPYKNFKKTTFP